MNYFRNIRTEEGASKRYRKLAFEHHPDRTGGDDGVMKEINRQYRELCEKFEAVKARQRTEEGDVRKRTQAGEKTQQSANMKADFDAEEAETVEATLHTEPRPERRRTSDFDAAVRDAESKIADVAATAFTEVADIVIGAASEYLRAKIRAKFKT